MDLISEEYRQQNAELHRSGRYGRWGYREAENILKTAKEFRCETVLDYGCGAATLSKSLPLPVTNYDPAIEEYSKLPTEKHDMLVLSDVCEHIEPEYLDNVLETVRSLTEKVAYFVIATSLDGTKTLPDGRDPHLIVEEPYWWVEKIRGYMKVHNWYKQDRREAVVIICVNE